MAAASVQRLASGLAGPFSFAAGSNRASEAQQLGVRKIVPAGFGPSKGLGSWKTTRRRAGVQCSLGVSKVFAGVHGLPKLPLGSLLGDLRENNKDVKWALDYWDQELEDGYKSLDEWKGQLSNLRQGNPTIKWAFDYWDKELEDGYKSLDEWGAALTDIRAGVWLDKLRAQNPDVKWALDYWDQELIDGYKSLDEWKAQAADIGNFFSQNPLYVALGVGVLFIPILLYVSLNKGYAGNLSASEAFARLNGEDSAVLVDIRSKDEKAAQGGPKLGKKVLAVAAEGDGSLSSAEELRAAVKDRVADRGTVLVVLDGNGAVAPQAAKALGGEGYSRVYAISGGAEGPQGWRASQLPWRTPQTFTLDLGEIKDAVTSKIQEMQENIQDIPILGVAAAAGVSLILFTEAETALQLLGSAAVIQVFAKKLLFAKDRQETVKKVQSFLDTEVASQELKDDLQGLTGQLMSKAEATAEAEASAASPVSVLSKPTTPKAEAPKEKSSASVDSESDFEATEETIPEANVPDFLKEEGETTDKVAEASRAQAAAAAAKDTAEVDSKKRESGTVGVTASVPEVEVSKAAESVVPDAEAGDVLAAAEAEIPEANVVDVLSEEGSGEGVDAKADDVLETAEAQIPEANVVDVLSEENAVWGVAKAEDVVKAAEAEIPEAKVVDVLSEEDSGEGVDAKADDVLKAAEAEIPEANVADALSENDTEAVGEPVVAAKESTDKTPRDASEKVEGVSAVAEDVKEKTQLVGKGLSDEDAKTLNVDQASAKGPAAVLEPVQGVVGEALEGVKEASKELQEGAKSAAGGVKSKAEELAVAAAQKIDTAKAEEEPVEDASTSSDTSVFGQVADEGSEEVSNKTEEVSEKVSKPVTGAVKEAAGDLQEKAGEAVEKVREPVAELTSKAKEAVSDAAGKGKEAVSKTKDTVSETGDAVSSKVSKAGDAISETGDVVNDTGDAVSATGKAVNETGDSVSDKGDAVSQAKEAVSDSKEEVKELVVEPASGALETVGELKENGAVAITAKEQQLEEFVGELGVAQKEDGQEQNGAADVDEKKVEEATRAIKEAFAPGTQESAPEADVITLLYDSGWERAYIHFSADGNTWTELPGVQLGYDAKERSKAIQIPASSILFVLTNGNGDWDSPAHGGNYLIGSSGTYRLSYGTISTVSKVGK